MLRKELNQRMEKHPVKPPQIEQAIRAIKAKYEIGKSILKQCGPKSSGGEIVNLAEKYHINRDTAQKLRAMAIRGTGYTDKELERWYHQFRQAGFALTISHFVKLISVPKGKDRDDLTRRAISDHWSSHRFQAEIVKRLGRRQSGGRKPGVVIDDQFEEELSRKLWSWERWLKSHLEAIEAICCSDSPDVDVPVKAELLKEVKSLHRKISKLHDSLTAGP